MLVVPSRRRSSQTSLLFACIVAALCIWILSLPVFPTQDGPIHRYYTHVLDSLLQHRSLYQMYEIRHPLPPYATHYALLLLLSRVFDYDLAEKLFVCMALVCFAYALRTCARAAGAAGDWISLLAAPVLLPWALFMGFFNFYLATGLFLWAAAFWHRAGRGKLWFWLCFALTVALLTFTHPVPLLLLIAVCALDLLLRWITVPPALQPEGRLGGWQRVTGLLFACAAFLFPLSLFDRQHANSALHNFGLHPHYISSALLLMGVSPYNTRSTGLWINGYRLSLYLLLLACMLLAIQAFRQAVRTRNYNFGSTFLIASFLLGIVLPIVPDQMNGTVYFATRLTAALWIGTLIAASASSVDFGQLSQRLTPAVAILLAVLTLVPAELYLRPVAREVHAEEVQPLPSGQHAVILLGYGLQDYVRFHRQLAFNPYQWAPALALTRSNDVLLDSPWLAQNIAPLSAVPGSVLTVAEITDSPFNKIDPPRVYGRSLPASKERTTMSAAQFVLYTGTPKELALGLAAQLDRDQAARFGCSQHGWYLLCLGAPWP